MAFAGLLRQVFALLLIAVLATPLFSQNLPARPQSTGGGGTVNLDFKFDETLGITFYVDMLGLEASKLPFSPEVRINPSEYILGTNDLLSVIITGTFSLNYRALVINAEGFIYIPAVGLVEVAGLTLLDARGAIAQAVEKLYRNVTVDIMLDKPRPLTIHISGDIPNPGRLSVPFGTRLDAPLIGTLISTTGTAPKATVGETATGSVFPSAVEIPGLSAGGVSPLDGRLGNSPSLKSLLDNNAYQLRSVTVSRKDGTTIYADMIDYFYGGNLNSNPLLKDGDQVYISRTSASDPKVSLSGAVNSQINIPYRSDDTIERLLRISGGLTSNADSNAVKLFRINLGTTQEIVIDLKQNLSNDSLLLPSDRIVIGEKTRENLNASVTVLGRAKSTGVYPIVDGVSTAFDIISMAGGIEPDALAKAAFINRKDLYSNEYGVPESSTISERIRGSDQYLQGLSWFEIEEKARKNRVFVDVTNEDALRSIRLFDGDSLFIPRNENTVFVYGQVNNPSFIPVDSASSLGDYITKVGGYSIAADSSKVYVIKIGSRNWVDAQSTIIESGDWVYVDRIPLDDLAQKRIYDIQKQTLELEDESKQRLYELQKQTLALEEQTQKRLYELQKQTFELDELSQQRLYELQRISLEIQETSQLRMYDLQMQGYKIQRQGLYVTAFAAILSALSTTVALVIFNRN